MSEYRQAYAALMPSSSHTEVAAVLQSIENAAMQCYDRGELIQMILDDIMPLTKSSSKSRLTSKDVGQALLTIKSLGKLPTGSQVVATRQNLHSLLIIFNAFKDDAEASNEALKCIANALLLIESARSSFVHKEVGGGDAVIDLLEKTTSPERIFLCSRLIFLTTVSMASAADYIRHLVEHKPPGHHGNIIEIVAAKLDSLTTSILASEKMAREAMSELLKAAFNLLLHYPRLVDDGPSGSDGRKVMGDSWSERLDGILPPLLRLFNTLPPTFPAPLAVPMIHVIHALITVPVTPSLKSKWFPPLSNPASPRSFSKTISPIGSPSAPDSPTGSHTARSESPSNKQGAFDRAFSRLSVRKTSSQRSSSVHPTQDTLLRAYDLLDVTLSHYLPGDVDPDDSSVRGRCQAESDSNIDDLVSPLVLLITRLCQADDGARKRMREWIVPEDLDRTAPLEGRADLLGRCLRLLACIHHTKLKDATGEMLFAICDSDPSTLASYVGYGNVAGFLFNKGIMSAPPAGGHGPPSTTADGTPINPITGVAQRQDDSGPEMTEEEKEREAEKLFVLFDRLEKSGALPPSQNPVRKAIAEGKGPRY
ncbi:hypothetical protein PHLGIDRAFT_101008 [Phlebiopsis gigantea 11061_1 CR5-6]|uniref:Uncharacterized protein n=1 Tax=Phlebiopsis gigantea (strain 11061_1 CR5-6) TaxID=745531 RepID=A0A0C3NYR0_PHLG1|nr:hypothetical protein PHLGIDRAFT_101008 [Phlebiopsis gigantea 11061_1 CR5-6]